MGKWRQKEFEKGRKTNSGNRWINDEPDVINMNHDEIVSCLNSNSFVCFSDFLFVHLIFMNMSVFFSDGTYDWSSS